MATSVSDPLPAPAPTPTTETTAAHIPPLLPSPFTNTIPAPTLLTQGAEALIYRTHHISSPSNADSVPACLKFRPSKAYRHPTLDARLTKQRVLAEARVLVKLSGLGGDGVKVPAVLALEWDVARKTKGVGAGVDKVRRDKARGGAWLLMEWIEGRSVKEVLRECDAWVKGLPALEAAGQEERQRQEDVKRRVDERLKELLRAIGRTIGVMHDKGGVVHGDLTSSNVMVRPVARDGNLMNGSTEDSVVVQGGGMPAPPEISGEIVLIDFGLATQSVQDEDRAVDLYVLERAFGSTHPKQEAWFEAEVLQHQDGYRGSFKGAKVVLKRLEEVRSRGRKRTMIG